MMGRAQHDWLILRCSSGNTLRLAQSLAWADIEAWSPAETLPKGGPRGRTRLPIRVPLMPSFVFVKGIHLFETLAIQAAPASPHPDFHLMRKHDGEPAYTADATLNWVRIAEQRGAAPENKIQWLPGAQVRVPALGFEGLPGTVVKHRRKWVWVQFPDMDEPARVAAYLVMTADQEPHRAAA